MTFTLREKTINTEQSKGVQDKVRHKKVGDEDEKDTYCHAICLCVYVISLLQLTSLFADLQYMTSNFNVLPFLESFTAHIHTPINNSTVDIMLHC